MKKKEEIFNLFLLFIIMMIINESKNVVEEGLMAPGKNGLLDFEKYFKINFMFSYSPNESQVIHKQSPSNIGKGRYNDNCNSRHHNKSNMFSEFHVGYISDGRVLWFPAYILSYSED